MSRRQSFYRWREKRRRELKARIIPLASPRKVADRGVVRVVGVSTDATSDVARDWLDPLEFEQWTRHAV